MNPALFYDTETSNLPDWHAPSESPTQPRIVQLAGILVDLDTRKELATLDVLCRSEGLVIPAETAAIHGITTEMAMDLGIPEHLAVEMLLELWAQRLRIAHNESFDARMVRIAQHRSPRIGSEAQLEAWKSGVAACTQKIATPILKLPPTEKMKKARFFKNKSANLGEAYEYFAGKPLEGAHSALVDVRACMTVYFGALDMPKEQIAA